MLATEMASPKTMPAGQSPAAGQRRRAAPRPVATRLWHERPGQRDPADREQFLDVELEPDAEHQQDDADLGELLGEVPVGDEAGRRRPHDDPGEEIADDGREPEPSVM